MAKFLRIGVHHKNVSGYTSKAWCVHRVGATVMLKWGAVNVSGAGRRRKIAWAKTPQHKSVRCRSEQRAREYVKKAVVRRIGHRYEKLPDSLPIARMSARIIRGSVAGAKREAARRRATFMFVDIVGSTRIAARMGDRRWSEVMKHCFIKVRSELRGARGREVNTTGDGILAAFRTPKSAIGCAHAIRDGVRTLGLEIRAGLHVGEYEIIGDEHVGIAIHIGARVAAKARASEVLISSAVKEMIPDGAYQFEDRGMHALKGVPNRWRLYAIQK
jgi:class 3 adenylate cyclase